MPEAELFLLFVRPFNEAGIRYVIGGSVAATFYGKPRFTHDVDFVVYLNEPEIHKLPDIFPPADFYLPPPEVIMAELRRPQKGVFNMIHKDTTFKADVYLTGRDELNAWAFRNKRTITFEGEPVILAPPEYVIVRKLEFYRDGHSDKHLTDIRAMLEVSRDKINQAELAEWIKIQGVEAEWKQVAP